MIRLSAFDDKYYPEKTVLDLFVYFFVCLVGFYFLCKHLIRANAFNFQLDFLHFQFSLEIRDEC